MCNLEVDFHGTMATYAYHPVLIARIRFIFYGYSTCPFHDTAHQVKGHKSPPCPLYNHKKYITKKREKYQIGTYNPQKAKS